ncbi:Uncharacterised protein [Mycobacteroides abscessus subsp. abscessus]|nr:Uncharacterised protein [Mycobacteroides abscessus subsp. abscessus]
MSSTSSDTTASASGVARAAASRRSTKVAAEGRVKTP